MANETAYDPDFAFDMRMDDLADEEIIAQRAEQKRDLERWVAMQDFLSNQTETVIDGKVRRI